MSVEASDRDVSAAIAQHLAWHEQAAPSALKREPRVFVECRGRSVLRRPFKRRGRWSVRWAGTACLTNPHEVDGRIVFTADWS